MIFLLPPETGGGPLPVEGLSGMLGGNLQRPGPETVARWVPVPPWWRQVVGVVHILLLVSEGL